MAFVCNDVSLSKVLSNLVNGISTHWYALIIHCCSFYPPLLLLQRSCSHDVASFRLFGQRSPKTKDARDERSNDPHSVTRVPLLEHLLHLRPLIFLSTERRVIKRLKLFRGCDRRPLNIALAWYTKHAALRMECRGGVRFVRRRIGELDKLEGGFLHEEDGVRDDAEHGCRSTGVEFPCRRREGTLARVVGEEAKGSCC